MACIIYVPREIVVPYIIGFFLYRPLQLSEFGKTPLQFAYSEIYHYNFIYHSSMPFSTAVAYKGPLSLTYVFLSVSSVRGPSLGPSFLLRHGPSLLCCCPASILPSVPSSSGGCCRGCCPASINGGGGGAGSLPSAAHKDSAAPGSSVGGGELPSPSPALYVLVTSPPPLLCAWWRVCEALVAKPIPINPSPSHRKLIPHSSEIDASTSTRIEEHSCKIDIQYIELKSSRAN